MTSRAGFAGDWHGDHRWAVAALARLADRRITDVFHVGDFGVWPGTDGVRYLRAVHDAAHVHGQTVTVVPGNHEDYDQVAVMIVDGDGWLRVPGNRFPRLRFAPRGHVWQQSGVRFAAVGGGGSIDRHLRREGVSWWPDEAVTRNDITALERNMTDAGWDRVDVLLTHDAPAGVPLGGANPDVAAWWLTPDVLRDCDRQRVLLREGLDIVGASTLVHGHWHRRVRHVIDGIRPDGTGYACRVVGLDQNGSPENLWTATWADLADGTPDMT